MRASFYLTFLFLLTLVNTVSGVERGDCSFGNNYSCGYFFPKEDWEWQLKNYNIDHTTGKAGGGYLNVNATDRVNTTRVSSPSFLPSGDVSKCVTFWYRLSGPEVNALRVYVHRPSKLDEEDVMWETKEKTDRIWYFGRVPIIQSALYKVTFEMEHASGKVKKKAASYASLDDIVFTPGPCSVIPDSAKTGNAPKPFPPVRKLPAITPQNSPHNCTFEKNNMCNWIHSTGNKFNWTLRRSGSVNRNSGPRNDHTKGQFNNGLKGYYLYIVPNSDNLGQKARFESQIIKPDEAKCLVFWYHMWGSYIETLRVFLRVNGTETLPLWVRQKAQGKRWNRATISFQMQKDFQIIFEAVASPRSIISNIAVDDIAVLPSGCPVDDDFCDFEDGTMCGYKASSTIDWIHSGGPLVAINSPIDYDHTSNSAYGHYLAVTNNSIQTEFSSTLNLPPRPFKGDKCLRFWYYMSRNTSTQLYVTSSSTKDEHLFNSDAGATNFANTWQVAQVEFDPSSDQDVTLSFTVKAAGNETFVVGLDDVEIRDGFCGYAGDCNFEYGDKCVWSNGFDDNFDWTLQNGKTDTQFAGPSYDHTFENYNGTYIYIEASKPQRPGDKARLYSNGFPNTTPKMCLHFWYNMNGYTIGRLTIFQKFANGDEVGLWQLKGAKSSNWLYGKVPFSGGNGPFRLMFEATVGGEWGDIALDDIVVSENDCQMTPSTAIYVPPVTTPPKPPTTTPIPVYKLLDCEFETDFCEWYNPDPKSENWTIGDLSKLDDPPPYIPPSYSRNQNSNYMYLESGYKEEWEQTAVLQSPLLRTTADDTNICFSFKYYMFGSRVGNLTIYLKVYTQKQVTPTTYVLWKRVRAQPDIWQQGSTTLNLPDAEFEIVIEGKLGYDGVIAMDSFSLAMVKCQTDNVCDFSMNRTCSWFPDVTPLTWGIGIPTAKFGPKVDHTSLSEQGVYMYVQNDPTIIPAMAEFVSPGYPPNFGTQCFTFWYNVRGSKYASLSVKMRTSNTSDDGISFLSHSLPLWHRGLHVGDRWLRGQVTISSYERFQLVLEGDFNMSKSVEDYIAVDDFQMLPNPCDHPGSCNFDDGFCGYSTYGLDDDFNWLVGHGQTQLPEIMIGPPFDASGQGMYAYGDFTSSKLKYVMHLRSEEIAGTPTMNSFCLQFWYLAYGHGDILLYVRYDRFELGGLPGRELWSTSSESGTDWNLVSLQFNSTGSFRILFVTVKSNSEVFIGIDEISITPSTSCEAKDNDTGGIEVPAVIYACDFENQKDICEYWHQAGKVENWLKTSGLVKYGPQFDHTMKTGKGQYLLAKPDPWSETSFRLQSDFVKGKHKCCFRFWYFMSADAVSDLKIIVRTEDKKEKIVWKRSGMQGHVWKYAQVDITAVNYNIIIETQLGKSNDKFVAIDDVSVLMSECPELETCTFDDGHICFLSQVADSEFNWQISTDQKPKYFPDDHTTGTRFGNYLYLNTTGKKPGQTAIISSPHYDPGEICVQFWFYMSKIDATLVLESYKGFGKADIIANFDFVATDEWIHASSSLSSFSKFQFRFMAMAEQLSSDYYIALDDVSVTKGQCERTKFCDFEKDSCNWHYSPLHSDYDWIAHSSLDDHPPLAGFPPFDHSTGLPSGYYLTTSNRNVEGNTRATITSSVIMSDAKCLSFWYYVSYPEAGTIKITYTSSTEHETPIEEFTASNISEKWIFASYDLDEISDDSLNYILRIQFFPVIKSAIFSIDDILIENQPCDFSVADSFHCDGGNTTIPKTQVCDYKFQCKDKSDELNCGSCNFENGDCNYTDTSNALFLWQVGGQLSAAQITDHILDTPDHTYGNETGKFMFVSTLGTPGNSLSLAKAIVNSPRIQFSSATCHMTYWQYSVSPDLKRDVEVDVVYAFSEDAFEIHSQKVDPGEWTQVYVYVGRIHRPFTLRFTIMESYQDEAILAIDDIKMIDCGPPINNHAGCESNEIRCVDDFKVPSGCVSKSQECDFTDDCTTGKDEANCTLKGYTMFDFEDSSFGVWMNNLPGYGRWEIQIATNGYKWYPRDHTTNSPEGRYLVIKDGLEYARIASFVFLKTTNCTMRFYYLFYGDSRISLRIFTWTERNGKQTEWFKRDRFWGDYYLREEIQFSVDENFEIVIEARIEDQFVDIMLDDFSFDSNCVFNPELNLKSTQDIKCQDGSKFICDNATCLNETLVCNFEYDCADKSDEDNCAAACDFEKDTCGWSDNSVGIYRWKRVKAISLSQPGTTPDKDHTLNSTVGRYMSVVRTKNSYTGIPSAYLETPILGMTATTCVFSFAYHTSSANGIFKLNVRNMLKYYDDYFEKTVLFLEGTQPKEWKEVNFTLGRLDAGCQVVFEAAFVNEHLKGSLTDLPDFVVDDIKFTHCSAVKEIEQPSSWGLNCTFDNGLCRWYQEHLQDNADWTLGNGPSSQNSGVGPRHDHTNQSVDGSYIFVENNIFYQTDKDVAWLRSPLMPRSLGSCLYFWYHMFGENAGTLQVFVYNADDTGKDIIWSKSGSQGNVWRLGYVNVVRDKPYQIVFSGTDGVGYKNSIAIDDISYVNSPCPQIQTYCDFELNNCGWRESESSIGVPWQVDQARRAGFQIRDHTTDSEYGNVLYFTTSYQAGKKVSSTAVNDVQRRSSPKGACVQFWYILSSGDLSSLNIGATYNNESYRHNESFTELYSDNWHFGQLNISENVDYTLDIEFVTTPKSNLSFYVLVDDIMLRNESCQPLGACDFENDFCGWEIFDSKDFKLKWLRSSAETPSKFSGPSVDKTLETADGFYLFLDSSFSRTGSASIMSPELKTDNATACFSFWYYMWGLEVGELSVSVVLSNERSAKVFSMEGDKGKDWHPAQLEIRDITPTFHLVIKGTLNGFKDGDIAIDEFSINPDKCADEKIENLTTTTTTPRIITRPVTTPISSTTKSTTTATPTSTQSTEKSTQIPSSSSTQPSIPSVTTEKIEPTPTTNQPKSSPHSSSTESTTRKPIVSCGNGKLSCGPNFNCIRSSYWCDGFKDCPNNADEEHCPTPTNCGEGRTYCATDHTMCLDNALICDGIAHCNDGSDEQLCECSNDFCRHQTTCSLSGNKWAICSCGNDYTGNRCQFEAQTALKSAGSKGWIAPVVIGVIVVVAIAVFVYLKKFYIPKPAESATMSIDNPAYDYNEQDNYHSFGFHDSGDTSIPEPIPLDEPDKGIVNPLYK